MFADQQIGGSPDIAVGYHSRNPNSILSESKQTAADETKLPPTAKSPEQRKKS